MPRAAGVEQRPIGSRQKGARCDSRWMMVFGVEGLEILDHVPESALHHWRAMTDSGVRSTLGGLGGMRCMVGQGGAAKKLSSGQTKSGKAPDMAAAAAVIRSLLPWAFVCFGVRRFGCFSRCDNGHDTFTFWKEDIPRLLTKAPFFFYSAHPTKNSHVVAIGKSLPFT